MGQRAAVPSKADAGQQLRKQISKGRMSFTVEQALRMVSQVAERSDK
jgi:hypothetical protein